MLLVPKLNTIINEPIKVTAIFSQEYPHNIKLHSFQWNGKTYKIHLIDTVIRFTSKTAKWESHNPQYPEHTFFTVYCTPEGKFFQLRCNNELTDWHIHFME